MFDGKSKEKDQRSDLEFQHLVRDSIDRATITLRKHGLIVDTLGTDGELKPSLFYSPARILVESTLSALSFEDARERDTIVDNTVRLLAIYYQDSQDGLQIPSWSFPKRQASMLRAVLSNISLMIESDEVQNSLVDYYNSESYLWDYKDLLKRYPNSRVPDLVPFRSNSTTFEIEATQRDLEKIYSQYQLLSLNPLLGSSARSDLQLAVFYDEGLKPWPKAIESRKSAITKSAEIFGDLSYYPDRETPKFNGKYNGVGIDLWIFGSSMRGLIVDTFEELADDEFRAEAHETIVKNWSDTQDSWLWVVNKVYFSTESKTGGF